RRKDNSIEYFVVEREESNIAKQYKKIPFVRGIVELVQASTNGIKHLDFAYDRYDVDSEDDEKMLEEKEPSKLVMMLGNGVVGVIYFIVSKLIFTVKPAIVANFFTDLVPKKTR